ncbi:TPA: hypothetical protein HA344_08980 [Candidatus Bathyarchaeota archaeon]|nr:hypothetical protein [Candidatus Bathyarchaeota archaeon]
MANLGRLFSEGSIILLVMGLEYFTLKPLFGELIGLSLVGVTALFLILDVLRNIL